MNVGVTASGSGSGAGSYVCGLAPKMSWNRLWRRVCNGMTRKQRRFALSRLCLDSVNVVVEPIDRTSMPGDVPRTWIMTLRDRALSVRQQHNCMTTLGGVDVVIFIDTCHNAMISEPKRLAAILIERCRRYA